MEPIEYKISGITYFHEELTWGQDKELIALITRVSNKIDPDEAFNVSAQRLQELLTKYDILEDFWGIVLRPQKTLRYWVEYGGRLLNPFTWRRGFLRRVNLSGVPNSDLEIMFENFFFLNKSLVKKLSTLNNAFSFIARQTMEMENIIETKKFSSSTPRKPATSPPASGGK